MIEELLKAKKISPEKHDLYMLFQFTELGRKVLDKMTMDTFMEEAKLMEFGESTFAFYDGRRSVFRDIRWAIKLVEDELRKLQNV